MNKVIALISIGLAVLALVLDIAIYFVLHPIVR